MSLRRMAFVGLHCVWLIVKDGVRCVGGFPDEEACYEEHLRQAVEYAACHLDVLLVLSGGMTRWAAGRVSEAESALELLEYRGWYGHPEVKSRTKAECFATLSFENLWMSLCVFRHHVGQYPAAGIVGFGWLQKSERYDIHRLAIGWPPDLWEFRGLNLPPFKNLQAALEGERQTLELVKGDLFMRGPAWALLIARRDESGNRYRHPYREWAPEMAEFINFVEQNSFHGSRPWAIGGHILEMRDIPEAAIAS